MFKIVPTVAHAGSTKIFITDQTRLLQYKRVYNSTKILTLEIIFSAQTSNTNVLFQHKYVYCTINQIFFTADISFFQCKNFHYFPVQKKIFFSHPFLSCFVHLVLFLSKHTGWFVYNRHAAKRPSLAQSLFYRYQ